MRNWAVVVVYERAGESGARMHVGTFGVGVSHDREAVDSVRGKGISG